MSLPIDTIICGNNVEVMAGWPDECIDLTVTSCPYDLVDYDKDGNLITHSDKGLRDYNGYEWDFTAVAQQLYRVTKQGGVCVWVVNDATVNGSETGSSFRQALYFMGLGFNLHDTMIYRVKGTGAKGSHYAYTQEFEFMFVFSKGTPATINKIRDKVNLKAGSRTNYKAAVNGKAKTRLSPSRIIPKMSVRGNVWEYHAGNNGDDPTSHSAPFPEALAHDHIISWSNPGDLVLDPFMGSGTTAKMAHLTDRHFIGIDISPEYCQLAQRRVAAVKQQPRLFSWDLEPTNQQPEVEPV